MELAFPEALLQSFVPKTKEEFDDEYDKQINRGWLSIGIVYMQLKHAICTLEPSDLCFTFHQYGRCCSTLDKALLNDESKKWRDMVRRGKITVSKEMCFSTTILGKKYYMLVLEYDEVEPDPILLMIFKIMAGGSYMYFFRNEKNRDAIFNFVNDVPKHKPVAEEKDA